MSRPSPGRDRILRYVLGMNVRNVQAAEHPLKPYPAQFTSIYELAQRTGVAFSWVHETLDVLSHFGWIDLSQGLRIRDADAIFAWWLNQSAQPRYHAFHVANAREASARLLHDFRIPNAFTTYYAENAYQGHLFPRRADVYVRMEHVAQARAHLVGDLNAQLGGTNFRLIYGDDHILDEKVSIGHARERLDYAPVPQVILDLMREGGSAREAADLLIQRAFPHARTRVQ